MINSKARNILVKRNKDKLQKLELKNNTVISGDIIFESGKGEIILSQNSEVQGNVTGGKIVKK